jgi:hypothetical protein
MQPLVHVWYVMLDIICQMVIVWKLPIQFLIVILTIKAKDVLNVNIVGF